MNYFEFYMSEIEKEITTAIRNDTPEEVVKELQTKILKLKNCDKKAKFIYDLARVYSNKFLDLNFLTQQIIAIGNAEYIFKFSFIKGVDIEVLTDGMILTGESCYIYRMAKFASKEGLDKIEDTLLKIGDTHYIIKFEFERKSLTSHTAEIIVKHCSIDGIKTYMKTLDPQYEEYDFLKKICKQNKTKDLIKKEKQTKSQHLKNDDCINGL